MWFYLFGMCGMGLVCLWLALFVPCFGGLILDRIHNGVPPALRKPTPEERAELGDAGSCGAFWYWKALPVTIPFVIAFWPMLLACLLDNIWRRR